MMRCYVVPGRVELVGKHVDYAGGRSLTCAVDRAITACATPLAEPILRVRDVDRRERVELAMSAEVARARGWPGWSSYALAVARRFARDFPDARTGVDIELRSTLPPSAGLSSSTALVVAIASALVDANDMERNDRWRDAVPDTIARAEYFAAMETGAPYRRFPGDEGVGVRGGAQDHVAIMCAEAEHVGQFSYLPARLERRIAWPTDYELAIGVSGVTATKTGNARARYNRAADATRALVGAWNAATGRADATLADALASGTDAYERLTAIGAAGVDDFSPQYLVARLTQFREEIERIVPESGDALRDRDFVALGRLVDRSQELAEQALENQVAETIALQRSARELGAVAASAFGAGFGGAVWAMIANAGARDFLNRWRERYTERFAARAAGAQWLLTRPSSAAREVAAS